MNYHHNRSYCCTSLVVFVFIDVSLCLKPKLAGKLHAVKYFCLCFSSRVPILVMSYPLRNVNYLCFISCFLIIHYRAALRR